MSGPKQVTKNTTTLTCTRCHDSRVIFKSQLIRYALPDGMYLCRSCLNYLRSSSCKEEDKKIYKVKELKESSYIKNRKNKRKTLTCTLCLSEKIITPSQYAKISDIKTYRCPACIQKEANKPYPVTCPSCKQVRFLKNRKRTGSISLCLSCSKKGNKSGRWQGGRVCIKCSLCGAKKKVRKSRAEQTSDSYMCASCYVSSRTAERNPNWKGGVSFIKYPEQWTVEFKKEVRKRDNCTCFICGRNRTGGISLDVHHIDYNKHNLDPINLITLCRSCHIKTNSKRQYWEPRLSFEQEQRFYNAR